MMHKNKHLLHERSLDFRRQSSLEIMTWCINYLISCSFLLFKLPSFALSCLYLSLSLLRFYSFIFPLPLSFFLYFSISLALPIFLSRSSTSFAFLFFTFSLIFPSLSLYFILFLSLLLSPSLSILIFQFLYLFLPLSLSLSFFFTLAFLPKHCFSGLPLSHLSFFSSICDYFFSSNTQGITFPSAFPLLIILYYNVLLENLIDSKIFEKLNLCRAATEKSSVNFNFCRPPHKGQNSLRKFWKILKLNEFYKAWVEIPFLKIWRIFV